MSDIIKKLLSFENDNERIEFEAEIIHMNFIQKIKGIMKEKNISKDELSRLLGTPKEYITQVFCGDKLLNLKLLAKLQRILNINIELNYKGKNDE